MKSDLFKMEEMNMTLNEILYFGILRRQANVLIFQKYSIKIRTRYPAESLYHELFHAYYDDQNMSYSFKDSKLEEGRAVRGENLIRNELGYPNTGRTEREYYWPWPLWGDDNEIN